MLVGAAEGGMRGGERGAVSLSLRDGLVVPNRPDVRLAGHGHHPRPDESGRGFGAAQHRTRVTVAANGHDLAISYVKMLGKGNAAEGCVDIEDGDTVLAIHHKPDNFDALQDAGKLVEPLPKRRRATIGVRG